MKVLFTKNYGEEKFNKVKELGYEVIYYPEKDVHNNEHTNECNVLVTYNPFNPLDISKLNKLRYIQTTSVGVDQIPKDKLKGRNILICNNKGGYSVPISEWVVMYILEIYKNRKIFYDQQENKKWKMNFNISELKGRKIGFLGTGTIATECAKRLKSFEVEIYGINTSGKSTKYFDKCVSIENSDDVFKNSDVIVSTIPSTMDTIGILNEDKFKRMKDGSIFINVGRGSVVNEKDLIKYIYKFKGVALDVFENEPLNQESKLWDCDNVIITPHNSWISDRNDDRNFDMIYKNLKSYINNELLKNMVNIQKGY